MLLFALAAAAVGVGALLAPGEKEPQPAPAAVSAPVMASAPPAPPAPAAKLSKQEAMNALMSLPELKAWSALLEKTSGGQVRGALIEYDQQPKLVDGVSYWQFSFVENGSDAAHRWESFLVAGNGVILVEDLGADRQLTLAEWRQQKRPLERSAP